MRTKTSILVSLLVLVVLFVGVYKKIDTDRAVRENVNIKMVKIGAALALTGDAAPWGEASKNAALLAEEYINANKITKHPVKVVFEDMKSSSKDSVSAVSKLLNIDSVDAVMITWLDSYLGSESVVPKNKILISQDAAIEAVNTPVNHENVFSLWYRTKAKADTVIGDMKKQGVKKVYMVMQEDSYYKKLEEYFTVEASKQGIEIMATENLLGTTDTKTTISKIISAKPDVVFFGSYNDQLSVNFFKNFSNLAASKVPLYGDEFVAQNIKNPSFKTVWFENVRFFLPTEPNADFAKRYTARFGNRPEFSAINTYDTVLLLAQVIDKGGDSVSALKTGTFDTLTFGKITFDNIGGVVSSNPAISMNVFKDGQIVPIK